jgi:predicted esterase
MKRIFIAVSLVVANVAAPSPLAAVPVTDFLDFSLRDAFNQVLLPGRLYVPPEAAQSGPPRPLIINLHGSGANGTDNLAQLTHVAGHMLTEAKDRGAFLYAPQATSTWSSQLITGEVMTMIDRAINTLNADKNRVYIVGYSQGSHGTWTMLSRYNGRFAAGIPISGGVVQSDFVPSRLIDTPIITLHARDDATAAANNTRNAINSILAAAHEPLPTYPLSNNPATFTLSNANLPFHVEFRDLVHQQENSIDFLVSNPALDLIYYEPQLGGHTGMLGALEAPQLYEWMFSHSLAVPEPSACSLFLIAGLFALTSRRHTRSAKCGSNSST